VKPRPNGKQKSWPAVIYSVLPRDWLKIEGFDMEIQPPILTFCVIIATGRRRGVGRPGIFLNTEVNYGLLMLTGLPRDLLPQPTHKIIVIDTDGERFEAKMRSSALRIDGLTQLHRKHRTYKGERKI
jgi:hypothetical protein